MVESRKKILFVCTGNTCRSPMAEVLMRKLAEDRGMGDEVRILSAGLGAMEGMTASGYAVEVMRNRGISLSQHQSRPVDDNLLAEADFIFTMTRSQKDYLLYSRPDLANKVFALAQYCGEDIADPFGNSLESYELCAQQLEKCLDFIWQGIDSDPSDKVK